MTDSIIRRFRISGVIADDSKFAQMRETYYLTITSMMKDQGYIPLLDVEPVWKTSYDAEKEHYDCIYTWQGIYVGENAWDFNGATGQKLIPIPQSK